MDAYSPEGFLTSNHLTDLRQTVGKDLLKWSITSLDGPNKVIHTMLALEMSVLK